MSFYPRSLSVLLVTSFLLLSTYSLLCKYFSKLPFGNLQTFQLPKFQRGSRAVHLRFSFVLELWLFSEDAFLVTPSYQESILKPKHIDLHIMESKNELYNSFLLFLFLSANITVNLLHVLIIVSGIW